MALFWQRKVVVRYGGFTITAPKIHLDLQFEADATATTGTIQIYNLAKSTERAIEEAGGEIEIEAGYGERTGRLLKGSVQRIEKLREGLARIVKLHVSSQNTAPDKLGGTFIATYEGRERVERIARDIVVGGLGLKIGSTEILPPDLVVNWSHSGIATSALSKLLSPYDITWREDENGVVQFNKAGSASPAANSVKLTEKSGLIESPSVTEDGVKMKSLLNPEFRIGTVIDLRSDFVNGQYKVVSLVHQGDNWEGSFFTEMDTRPV